MAHEDQGTKATDESVVELEQVKSLMFRRAMMEQSIEEPEPAQRKNIFQTV